MADPDTQPGGSHHVADPDTRLGPWCTSYGGSRHSAKRTHHVVDPDIGLEGGNLIHFPVSRVCFFFEEGDRSL